MTIANNVASLRSSLAAIVEDMAALGVASADNSITLTAKFGEIARQLYKTPVEVGQLAKDCGIDLSVAGLDKDNSEDLAVIRFQRAARDSIRRGLKAASLLLQKERSPGGKTKAKVGKAEKSAADAAEKVKMERPVDAFQAVCAMLDKMNRDQLLRVANAVGERLRSTAADAPAAPAPEPKPLSAKRLKKAA